MRPPARSRWSSGGSHRHLAGRHRSVPARWGPLGAGVGDPLRRPRRHGRHPVRIADRPRPADASADRAGGPRVATASCRSACAATGHRPTSWTGWPSSGMRSFEMTEVVAPRASRECLTEAFGIALDECDGVFLSVDIDVCDPGHAPGTGTPEPGGLSARQLLDAVRRICLRGSGARDGRRRGLAAPYHHAWITASLGNRLRLRSALCDGSAGGLDARDGTTWDPRQPLLSERTAPIPDGDVYGHHHTHPGQQSS